MRAAALAALAGASAAGAASAGSSSAALVPPLWPTQFDAEWDLCCEYGTTSWHGTDWLDHQTVSYDYALRRQSTLHTDRYGQGPGRDWILPNGNIVFRSDNSTTRFKAPCCIVFEKLGMVTPDWARRDPPT